VPLLRGADLCDGHDLLLPGHYAFAVQAFGSPIQRALRRTADGATEPFHPEHVATRTQDLEPAYHDAGQFYWAHAQTWLAELPIHAHARTLVLPDARVVDIDSPADWARAEALYRMQLNQTAEALA
jgi:CMP-N-acetylneuraminic acid synthetase